MDYTYDNEVMLYNRHLRLRQFALAEEHRLKALALQEGEGCKEEEVQAAEKS